ncbi:AT-rich interactive domain-containing protein 1A-like [Entelurus aequoreus]|uniref:AT-rich interactive domain-containing protein 1A-like n=1 Tax=Entelurus aequoreus TaxID=161455 RepID=UPI002B1D881C|nr:AT-rich interactive domain-containing protein 1A-like [Entelurus aequoreus]
MAKCWRATSLVALALLCCFYGTKVKAWRPNSPSGQKSHLQSQSPNYQQLPWHFAGGGNMSGSPHSMPSTSHYPPKQKNYQPPMGQQTPEFQRMNYEDASHVPLSHSPQRENPLPVLSYSQSQQNPFHDSDVPHPPVELKPPVYLPPGLPHHPGQPKPPVYSPSGVPHYPEQPKPPVYLPSDVPQHPGQQKPPVHLQSDVPQYLGQQKPPVHLPSDVPQYLGQQKPPVHLPSDVPQYPGQQKPQVHLPSGVPHYPGQQKPSVHLPSNVPHYPGQQKPTVYLQPGVPHHPGQQKPPVHLPSGVPHHPGQQKPPVNLPPGVPHYPEQQKPQVHLPSGVPHYPGQQKPQVHLPSGVPHYPGQQKPQVHLPSGVPHYPGQQKPQVHLPSGVPHYPGQQKPPVHLPSGVPHYPGQQKPPVHLQQVGYNPPTQHNQVVAPPMVQYPQQNPSFPPQYRQPHYPSQRTLSSPQQHNGPSQSKGTGYAVPRGFADQPAQNSQHAGQKTGQQPSHPHQPNVCDVAGTQRVPCGSHDISAAGCEAISCCYDGQRCYFGKSVTVQCTKDGQFIVVVAKESTVPVIDLETISLIEDGQGCTHVDSNSAFVIYQFPVTRCGTVIMEDSGVIVYENRMTSMYEVAMGPLGAITRDTSYNLLFQCRYTGTSVETFIVEVQAIAHPVSVAAPGPLNVELRLANGQCHSKGCVEEHVVYSSFYTEGDYPVTKILRDPVYAEVRLIGRTDPNLVLSLGRCWATTSANPHSVPQWDILIDGCPNRDDRYKTSLVPVGSDSGLEFLSHYKRFIFQMFTFVDPSSLVPQREHVYIHCSTSVCNAGAGYSCEPMCFRLKRDVGSTPRPSEDSKVVVSSGPVVMSVR